MLFYRPYDMINIEKQILEFRPLNCEKFDSRLLGI